MSEKQSIGQQVGRLVDVVVDLAASAKEVWEGVNAFRNGGKHEEIRAEVEGRQKERYRPEKAIGDNNQSSGS